MNARPKGSAAKHGKQKRARTRRSTKPPTPAPKLTDQQRLFVMEYLIDWNATQAAIRAGYSEKNASSIAYQLLQKTPVQEYLEQAKRETLERAGIRAESVLLELAKLGFASTADILTVDETGNVVMRPGSEIPRAALDAVSSISASDTETVSEREGKGGTSTSQTRTRTISLKLHDKRAALMDLARYLRLMPGQLEVTGKNGAPIQMESTNAIPEEQREERLASLIGGILSRRGDGKS